MGCDVRSCMVRWVEALGDSGNNSLYSIVVVGSKEVKVRQSASVGGVPGEHALLPLRLPLLLRFRHDLRRKGGGVERVLNQD